MNLNNVLNKISEWIFGPSLNTLSQKAEDTNLPLDQRVEALYKMIYKGSLKHTGDKELVIRAYNSLPEAKKDELDTAVYYQVTDVHGGYGSSISTIYSPSPECNISSPTFGKDQILFNPFEKCVEKALYFKSGLEKKDEIAWNSSLFGKISIAFANCLGFH